MIAIVWSLACTAWLSTSRASIYHPFAVEEVTALPAFRKLPGFFQRVRLPGCSFNSSSSGYWSSRQRSRSMVFFQSMTAGEGEQVRVLLAVVVVDVGGADAVLHER